MSFSIPSGTGPSLRCNHFRAPTQLFGGVPAGLRASRPQLSVRSKGETYQVETNVGGDEPFDAAMRRFGRDVRMNGFIFEIKRRQQFQDHQEYMKYKIKLKHWRRKLSQYDKFIKRYSETDPQAEQGPFNDLFGMKDEGLDDILGEGGDFKSEMGDRRQELPFKQGGAAPMTASEDQIQIGKGPPPSQRQTAQAQRSLDSMTKKGVSQKGAKIVGTGSNPSTANASRQNQQERSQNKAANSTSRNERQVVEDIMGETLTPESDPSQVRGPASMSKAAGSASDRNTGRHQTQTINQAGQAKTGNRNSSPRQQETPGSAQAKGRNPNQGKAQTGNGDMRGNFQKKNPSQANEKSKRSAQQVGILD
ncbi:hypothetical protein WJX74_001653 [Apatococcus lobatus]|uniref:Uncharacterized protein n=1 Tax=Apatococcus lobatus TaxID=904363 RepID=A0AAW1RYG6_9CHLO